ncbi:B12-binding domain-containing radical SAM protein [bacterium]|nr:B12-binding domain-containing radical SAM protein [bacterium]
MKVLLITPPIKNIIQAELPSALSREIGVFPPLGLMYIASYLRKYSDHRVRILDAVAEDLNQTALEQAIRESKPEIIGITAHTNNLVDVLLLTGLIKKIDPKIHINIGGPHARVFPQETLQLPGVDSVIPGEGEISFFQLVEALSQKKTLREVPGLIFKKGEKIISGKRPGSPPNLDRLPFPARGLIKSQRYYYILGRKSTFTTMVSSRGCPYRCTFCSTPKENYRQHSIRSVVQEMEECDHLGVEEIHFVDDTFNLSPEWVISLCQEIKQRGLRIPWSFRGRVDTLTREVLQKLKEANCIRMNLGVETSTDEGLKRLKKGLTIHQIEEVFTWTKEIGIPTVAYFLIGCPHEKSREDILHTFRFAKSLNPDFALFNILTPYPDTELYREGLEKGLFRKDFWREFALQPTKDFEIKVWEEFFTKRELEKILNSIYRRYYLRFPVILRNLKSILHPQDFFWKARAALKILGSS